MTINVGHLYQYGHHMRVLVVAIEDPKHVRVREVDHSEPTGMGRANTVNPAYLTPLPMRYFKGQVPR